MFSSFSRMKVEKLTEDQITSFGDRKHKGRLSVVVDTLQEGENLDIYIVPKDKEHIGFCLELVKDVRRLTNIIPSHIHYDNVEGIYEVTGVFTGESGMEQGYGVRHSARDLDRGHQRVLRFVNEGEVLVHPRLEARVTYRFKS